MKQRTIIMIILGMQLTLVVLLFLSSVKYGMPPGADANVYVMDAYTILAREGKFPTEPFIQYLGRPMYESPLNATLLVILHALTGLRIEYPLFSVYQFTVFLLILLLWYVTLRKLSTPVGGLMAFLLLNFLGIYFLFGSSTVANFLAFAQLLLLLNLWLKQHTAPVYSMTALIFVTIYFTHRSLGFVFLSIIALFYLILRGKLVLKRIFALPRPMLVVLIVGSIAILTMLLYSSYSIIRYTFFESSFIKSQDQFRQRIDFSTYLQELGMLNLLFAVIAVTVRKRITAQKDFITHLLVPWIAISILFSLLPYFGIYFYSLRMLYMAWVPLILLAGLGFWHVLRYVYGRRSVLGLVAVTCVLVFVVQKAVLANQKVFINTNLVTSEQRRAWEYIRNNTEYGENVLTNINDMHPFFTSIATRNLIQADFRAKTFEILNGIESRKVRYIVLTTGDKFGRTLAENRKLLSRLNISAELRFHTSDAIVLQITPPDTHSALQKET